MRPMRLIYLYPSTKGIIVIQRLNPTSRSLVAGRSFHDCRSEFLLNPIYVNQQRAFLSLNASIRYHVLCLQVGVLVIAGRSFHVLCSLVGVFVIAGRSFC
jgi:hypothetical protein